MPRPIAVVVHFGRIEPTIECLESLARSTTPLDVVVVDNQGNGSEIRERLEAPEAVRWIAPDRNLGFGRAVNRGIDEAVGEGGHDSALILNNDARVAADAIEHLTGALREDPRCALAVPRIVRDDGTLWYGGGGIDWAKGSAYVVGSGGPHDSEAALQARDVTFATGCAMLVSLEAWQEVGGFDPRYFLYEEDVELSLRLVAAGWTLRYVPAAMVVHGGQMSQRDTDEPFVPIHDPTHPRLAQLVELQVCNRLLTMSRHATGSQRRKFIFGFPPYWFGRCCAAALHGRPEAFLAAARGVSRYRRLRGESRDDPSTSATEPEPWSRS